MGNFLSGTSNVADSESLSEEMCDIVLSKNWQTVDKNWLLWYPLGWFFTWKDINFHYALNKSVYLREEANIWIMLIGKYFQKTFFFQMIEMLL